MAGDSAATEIGGPEAEHPVTAAATTEAVGRRRRLSTRWRPSGTGATDFSGHVGSEHFDHLAEVAGALHRRELIAE